MFRSSPAAALAPAHDCARDRSRVALLAELAEDPRQAALIPAGEDLARVELLLGVHTHIERGIVGVGEAALAGVHLHRGHPEVEVHHVRAQALPGEQPQRLGVATADEARCAWELLGELEEPVLGLRIPVDRHERPLRAQTLGHQARVAAAAEGAVDRDPAGPRARWVAQVRGRRAGAGGPLVLEQSPDQLACEHGDVDAGHVKQDGRHAR